MNANIFENGNGKTIGVPKKLTRACAAFHPTNPNRLYMFSGSQDNTKSQAILAYHFEDETFHQMTAIVPYFTRRSACEGYTKSNGHAVST